MCIHVYPGTRWVRVLTRLAWCRWLVGNDTAQGWVPANYLELSAVSEEQEQEQQVEAGGSVGPGVQHFTVKKEAVRPPSHPQSVLVNPTIRGRQGDD